MVKYEVKVKSISSIIRRYWMEEVLKLVDEDNNLLVDKVLSDYPNIITSIIGLRESNFEVYKKLLIIMFNDYILCMNNNLNMYSDEYLSISNFDDLDKAVQSDFNCLSSLFSAFMCMYQVDVKDASFGFSKIKSWDDISSFDKSMDSLSYDKDYMEEIDLINRLSVDRKYVEVFVDQLDDKNIMIYKDFIIKCLLENYRYYSTLISMEQAQEYEILNKIRDISSEETALRVFNSLDREDKIKIISLYVNMNTNFNRHNMIIRDHFKNSESTTKEYEKKLRIA